jgi:hypothetical protein
MKVSYNSEEPPPLNYEQKQNSRGWCLNIAWKKGRHIEILP